MRRWFVLGVLWAAVGLAGCGKKAGSPASDDPDGGKRVVTAAEFPAEFVRLHQEGVQQGFLGCLYGTASLPIDADEFIRTMKRRFESAPADFIEEKAVGCRTKLEETIDAIRLLVAPSAEVGAARDAYVDAATDMVDSWLRVNERMVEFTAIEEVRSEFNAMYARKLLEAGNEGWAVVQKCDVGKEEPLETCFARLGVDADTEKRAYRYLNFVLAILQAYDVNPETLLIEDTKAVEEGREYLLGVKALRDKLQSLCTGEEGTPTHIREWGRRVSERAFPVLDEPNPQRPELFPRMALWWSSDGARSSSGEAFSSYAVITDVCFPQGVTIDAVLIDFLKVYQDFVRRANEMSQAIAAAQR
jgi:hypothetical protein